MFRFNSFVRKFPRSLQPCKRYCTPKALKEKVEGKIYVIDVDSHSKCNQKLAKEIGSQHSLKKLELSDMREDQWKRLVCLINEIFDKYKTQALDKMKEMKIDEILAGYKKEIMHEKLKEKLKDVKFNELVNKETLKQTVGTSIDQWKTIKTSEGFTRMLSLPSTTLKFVNNMTIKAQHHWIVFNKSQNNQKIVHVVTIVVENLKRGLIELYKFIKFVYNAPVKK